MTGVHTAGQTARALAEAAIRFPDVVGLSSGAFGTLSTPVRGGLVPGITVRDDYVEIGVVVRYGRPLPEIATELRRGLASLAGGRVVHVSVEDVVAGLDGGPRTSG